MKKSFYVKPEVKFSEFKADAVLADVSVVDSLDERTKKMLEKQQYGWFDL